MFKFYGHISTQMATHHLLKIIFFTKFFFLFFIFSFSFLTISLKFLFYFLTFFIVLLQTQIRPLSLSVIACTHTLLCTEMIWLRKQSNLYKSFSSITQISQWTQLQISLLYLIKMWAWCLITLESMRKLGLFKLKNFNVLVNSPKEKKPMSTRSYLSRSPSFVDPFPTRPTPLP